MKIIKLPFYTRRTISHIIWVRTRDSKGAAERNQRFAKFPFDKKLKRAIQWTGWMEPVNQFAEVAHFYFLGLLKSKRGYWEIVGWEVPRTISGLTKDKKKAKALEKKTGKEELLFEMERILKSGAWRHEVGEKGWGLGQTGKDELKDPYWFVATKAIGWKYHPINHWFPLLILSFFPVKIYRELEFKEWLPLNDPDLKRL